MINLGVTLSIYLSSNTSSVYSANFIFYIHTASICFLAQLIWHVEKVTIHFFLYYCCLCLPKLHLPYIFCFNPFLEKIQHKTHIYACHSLICSSCPISPIEKKLSSVILNKMLLSYACITFSLISTIPLLKVPNILVCFMKWVTPSLTSYRSCLLCPEKYCTSSLKFFLVSA